MVTKSRRIVVTRAVLPIAAAILLTAACVSLLRLRPATAQETVRAPQSAEAQTGWLEGTVLTADGRVAVNPYNVRGGGVTVMGKRQGGGQFSITSDKAMGGLFSAQNIKPGIYEISVTDGCSPSGYAKLCPQRIHGVLVKPGVRTILNVIMEPGETLNEIGRPVVATEPAIVVSRELARLRSEIEALKAEKQRGG